MVFSKSKLMLEDNCFEEEPATVEMKFVGPGITRVYEEMHGMLKSVFNVPDSDIQESDYNWGKSESGEKFNADWWVHKDMDLFSYLFVRVRIKGEGTPKMGNIKITMRGLLRSEYPQDTIWQRSLFYEMLRTFWHRVFYHKKREEYAEDCRHTMILLQKKIKLLFTELKKDVETKES